MKPQPVILIGVRKHSQRVPDKAWQGVGGRPLYCWTFDLAQRLKWPVCVCTDDRTLRGIAQTQYGFDVMIQAARQPAVDWDWVNGWLQREEEFHGLLPHDQLLVILRITSPFRRSTSVRRAVRLLMADPLADSIRAVRPVHEHPMKMWLLRNGWVGPMAPFGELCRNNNEEWRHSRSYQELQATHPIYVQSSALDVTRVRTIRGGSLSGSVVLPFQMSHREQFTIDWPEDVIMANHLARKA